MTQEDFYKKHMLSYSVEQAAKTAAKKTEPILALLDKELKETFYCLITFSANSAIGKQSATIATNAVNDSSRLILLNEVKTIIDKVIINGSFDPPDHWKGE